MARTIEVVDDDSHDDPCEGLSLRDELAMNAMRGIMQPGAVFGATEAEAFAKIAAMSYGLADAMLAARGGKV